MSVVLMFTFVLVGCGDADEDATAGITQPPGGGGKADNFWADLNDSIWGNFEDYASDESENILDDGFDGEGFEEIPTEEGADQPELRVWEGDVDVTRANLDQIEPYHVIEGELRITNNPIQRIYLPNLLKVRGKLVIRDSDEVQEIYLPRLHTVSGRIDIMRNYTVKSVRLPKLQTVGRRLDRNGDYSGFFIVDNYELETLDISQLRHVKGNLKISGNNHSEHLTTIDLSNLETVGKTLMIYHQKHVRTLLLPQLRTVGAQMEIRRNFDLEIIKLPRLETIEGRLYLNSNKKAKHILFPVLTDVGGEFYILSNYVLETLLMPELKNISGEVRMSDVSINTCDLGSYTEAYCY